ncbi:MAG: exo-alpha-sialidase [Chloroflexi bacterium]|nr:exo-alpha-sialidase [Chloroflexota bacterium]
MIAEVRLRGRLEEQVVVATGRRWWALGETPDPEQFFREFPQCREDARRCHYGDAPFPPPFSRGGGLFPVLLLMDNADLACVVRTGAPHRGSGSELSLCVSRDRGRTWSDYQVVVSGDVERHWDPRNPTLGQAATGELVMVYGLLDAYDATGEPVGSENGSGPQGHLWMEVIRSSDGGQTWSAPARLEPPPDLALAPHGQMRRLVDGTLVFNARGLYRSEKYKENPGLPRRMTYLYWSRDHGHTWSAPTLIKPGRSETGFLPLDARHWVAFVRGHRSPSMLGHSYDGGQTWSKWEPVLGGDEQTQARRLPGSLVRTPNGFVIATYGYREYPFGVRAIVSRDGGQSFDRTREYVLADTYNHFDAGYPSTVCFPDGTIVTTAYANLDLDHPEWGTACIAYRFDQSVFQLT